MRRMAKVFKPRRGEAYLDTPTIAEVAPLPARHERGEGWGEGLVPPNCPPLLKSPRPDPPHFSVVGRGNRPRTWWWYQDAPQLYWRSRFSRVPRHFQRVYFVSNCSWP